MADTVSSLGILSCKIISFYSNPTCHSLPISCTASASFDRLTSQVSIFYCFIYFVDLYVCFSVYPSGEQKMKNRKIESNIKNRGITAFADINKRTTDITFTTITICWNSVVRYNIFEKSKYSGKQFYINKRTPPFPGGLVPCRSTGPLSLEIPHQR